MIYPFYANEISIQATTSLTVIEMLTHEIRVLVLFNRTH